MKVYELLDRPEKWTQGCEARDKNSNPVGVYSGIDVCWCLYGALRKCYPGGHYDLLCWVQNCMEPSTVGEWNDTPGRTYEEVVALCRRLDI